MTSFSCSIGSDRLRVFAGAVTALSKIGKELVIEVESGSLSLRALNDARSAFGLYKFGAHFFETFEYVPDSDDGNEGGCWSCKLHNRALQPLLRKASTSEKKKPGPYGGGGGGGGGGSGSGAVSSCAVKRLKITLVTPRAACDGSQPSEASEASGAAKEEASFPMLVFELQCDWGVRRQWGLTFSDTEVVQAVFDTSARGVHVLSAGPSQLTSILDHLYTSDEVSMLAARDTVTWRSFATDSSFITDGTYGKVNTEMSMASADFDGYTYGDCVGDESDEGGSQAPGTAVELVFNLREAKSLVSFCDAADVDQVHIYFSESGAPVLLCADTHLGCKAELVMATMDTGAEPHEEVRVPPSEASRTQSESAPRPPPPPTQSPARRSDITSPGAGSGPADDHRRADDSRRRQDLAARLDSVAERDSYRSDGDDDRDEDEDEGQGLRRYDSSEPALSGLSNKARLGSTNSTRVLRDYEDDESEDEESEWPPGKRRARPPMPLSAPAPDGDDLMMDGEITYASRGGGGKKRR